MFDIGWSEMAIIMLVALVVIGPKDLPRLARTLGQWVAKGRAMAREFQRSLEDMAREAELDDVKREIEKVGRTNIRKSIENTIDPKGELSNAFDPDSKTKKPANGGAPAANGAAGEPATAKPAVAAQPQPAAVEPKPAAPQQAEPAKAEAKTATTEPKPTKPAASASAEGAAKPKPRTKKTTTETKAPAKPKAAAKPETPTGTAPKPASSEKSEAETMAEPH